jgi:hypothetical protein
MSYHLYQPVSSTLGKVGLVVSPVDVGGFFFLSFTNHLGPCPVSLLQLRYSQLPTPLAENASCMLFETRRKGKKGQFAQMPIV